MSKGSTRRPSAIKCNELDARWALTFAGGSDGADGHGTAEPARPIDYGDVVWVNVSPTEGA